MKYKIIGFIVIAVVLMTAVCVNYTFDSDVQRYHQHIAEETDSDYPKTNHINESWQNAMSISMAGFVTHLPIVTIETNGQEIPVERKARVRINTDIKFYDTDGSGEENNTTMRKPDIDTNASIRARGNTSLHFDKKGLSVKLIKGNDEENEDPQEIFGMGKHDEWTFHGPYLDKTLIRNYMMYNLSGMIMDYAPNVRFCEMFINGEYRGVYLIVEKIEVSDVSRLTLTKTKGNYANTSYVLELAAKSGTASEAGNVLNTFSTYVGIIPKLSNYEILYPAPSNLTESQYDFIHRDINKFEKTLYSYDFDDPEIGYRSMIDVDSFVDYLIINEFSMNYDAGNLSTYSYKDQKGKLKLCVWDFNNAFNNYIREVSSSDFLMNKRIWFDMLLKDKYFTERVIERYHYLRENILSDEFLLNYIDESITYLGPAIERNFSVWASSFADEKNLLRPSTRNIHSYDEAVKQLKDTMLRRTAWMDKNIESLKHFSHESKTKNYNP